MNRGVRQPPSSPTDLTIGRKPCAYKRRSASGSAPDTCWQEYVSSFSNRSRQREPIEAVAPVLRHVRHTRVAVSGLAENFPFYGPELSNRVEYPVSMVGARFVPYSRAVTGWAPCAPDGTSTW